jgi:hypothetical protein
MKKILAKSSTTLIILLLAVWMSPLMAQTEEQIERFKQEMESYYNEKLQLTPVEKEEFWPVYNDYYNRKIKLDEDEKNTYRYCNSNVENMSDEEIAQALDRIMQLKDQKHNLFKEYHQKFLNILSPRKVLMLYKVERDFRMHLIRQIRRRGGDDSKSPRSGMGPGAGMRPGTGMGSGTGMGPGAGVDRDGAWSSGTAPAPVQE